MAAVGRARGRYGPPRARRCPAVRTGRREAGWGCGRGCTDLRSYTGLDAVVPLGTQEYVRHCFRAILRHGVISTVAPNHQFWLGFDKPEITPPVIPTKLATPPAPSWKPNEAETVL